MNAYDTANRFLEDWTADGAANCPHTDDYAWSLAQEDPKVLLWLELMETPSNRLEFLLDATYAIKDAEKRETIDDAKIEAIAARRG